MKIINLHSESTLFMLIIGVPMVALVLVSDYAPEYTTYMGYVMLAMIFIPIGAMEANAYIQGTRYPHIEHTIYEPNSGIALRVLDFFVDFHDPIRKIPDVYSAMRKRSVCPKCKKWLGEELESKEFQTVTICDTCKSRTQLRDYPEYFFGRWWHPYIVYTRWGVSFDAGADLKFDDIKMHFFILPNEFDSFMMFGKREEGAYLTGTNFTSGSSTHVDSILIPFAADYLGVKIPIYLSVFSRRGVKQITIDWASDMASLARYIKDMPRFLQQEEANLYPKKEMEEVMASVFPELKPILIQEKEKEET